MTERISQEEFKNKYGSDLSALKTKLALEPSKGISKVISAEREQAEGKSTRKKYVYLEYELQKNIAKYLNLKYPKVLFESSPINLRLTQAQRGMLSAIQKDGFSPPDMKIYFANRGYNGLALELKKETPFKQNEELKKSDHLQKQYASLLLMSQEGWHVGFYWEFDKIKSLLDWYLTPERKDYVWVKEEFPGGK
jgi:hypothetical protein